MSDKNKLPDLPNAAFVTGSQCYGDPQFDSDIDLVLMVNDYTYEMLVEESDGQYDIDEAAEYAGLTLKPLRFGKLNLICCTTEKQYMTWMSGTAMLIDERGGRPRPFKGDAVPRERAVEVFRELRRAAGLMKEPKKAKPLF